MFYDTKSGEQFNDCNMNLVNVCEWIFRSISGFFGSKQVNKLFSRTSSLGQGMAHFFSEYVYLFLPKTNFYQLLFIKTCKMKRVNTSLRVFLLLMTVSVSALFVQSCGNAKSQQTESPAKKNIGIQLWSVRDAMNADAAATIARLGEIGYTYVEAASYADGKFYGMEPAEFKGLLEQNGMSMRGSHTGINLPKEGEWEQAMQWWDDCIAAHKAVGAEWIVKPSMGADSYRSLDTLQLYCDYYNAIGEKCNVAGIRFGYHNHDREFTTEFDGVIFYDYLLQNTDPEKVMFELDLYWIQEGGKNAVDYFNQYPGRFELYHVKDVEELGASGTMDFQPAFEAAEKAGMKDYIVEVERYNFEPIVSVEKSFEFLNNAEYTK